jgi:hypothetical protein
MRSPSSIATAPSLSGLPPRLAHLRNFALDLAQWPAGDGRHHRVEDLQQPDPLLLAELADARRVVVDRLADHLTLRFPESGGCAAKLLHGGLIEAEGELDHTGTILPYRRHTPAGPGVSFGVGMNLSVGRSIS